MEIVKNACVVNLGAVTSRTLLVFVRLIQWKCIHVRAKRIVSIILVSYYYIMIVAHSSLSWVIFVSEAGQKAGIVGLTHVLLQYEDYWKEVRRNLTDNQSNWATIRLFQI